MLEICYENGDVTPREISNKIKYAFYNENTVFKIAYTSVIRQFLSPTFLDVSPSETEVKTRQICRRNISGEGLF